MAQHGKPVRSGPADWLFPGGLRLARRRGEVVVTSPDKDVMIPIEVVCDGEKPRYGVVENGIWKRPYKIGANLCVRNLADGRQYE